MLVCGLWMPTASVPKKMFTTVAARSVNIILVDCRYAVSAAAMLLQLLLLRIYTTRCLPHESTLFGLNTLYGNF